MGIYQIRNTVTGKVYVGSASVLRIRRSRHFRELAASRHHSNHLQHAWNKYGEEAFEFEILEQFSDPEILLEREQFWINAKRSYKREFGYNMRPIANSSLGMKNSPEHIEKTRQGHLGSKRSEEAKRNMSEAQLRRFAERPVKPETTKKQADWHRGRKRSTESKENISNALKGIPKSPEAVANSALARSTLYRLAHPNGEIHDNVPGKEAAFLIGCSGSQVMRAATRGKSVNGWTLLVTRESPQSKTRKRQVDPEQAAARSYAFEEEEMPVLLPV